MIPATCHSFHSKLILTRVAVSSVPSLIQLHVLRSQVGRVSECQRVTCGHTSPVTRRSSRQRTRAKACQQRKRGV
jgi:hypothetical protein